MYHPIAASIELLNKNGIHHINVVTKPSRILTNLFSVKKYFIRIVKLYIYMVLVNIRKNIIIMDLSTCC